MTRTRHENPVARLNPITDREAAGTVSEQALTALLNAVMEISAPVARHPHRARSRTPRRTRRLVLAAGVSAAVVLGATGAISGRGPTVAQPADAEILHGVAAALHPTGSIVLESFTRVTSCTGAHCGPVREGDGRYTSVEETARGTLARELVVAEPGIRSGAEVAIAQNGDELYDPVSNTVYRFSSYGHDLTPGPTPGTYVYHLPTQQILLRDEAVPGTQTPVPPDNAMVPALSLTVTAGQADDLRSGRARIDMFTTPSGHYALRVAPVFTTPHVSPAETARLLMGQLRVLGPTTVDGQRAIRLVPIHGHGELDVHPDTYYPIKEILGRDTTYTWHQYQVRPATQPIVSLFSPTARHPSARLDDTNAGFLAAWHRLTHGD